jgi:hypothetical protein
MGAPFYDSLGAMIVAILTIPLIPYHGLRGIQIWLHGRKAREARFLLIFHALSAISLTGFVLNGVWGGSCGIFIASSYGKSGFCSSPAAFFLVGSSGGGFFSNLGNLGFTLQIWLQASLSYYSRKEIAYAKAQRSRWLSLHSRIWKGLIGLLILLTMAGFGATLPHKNGISEPWLVAAIFGITLTSIVSLITFALVLKLWCTINYTYRILPYVPTRTLLIIATLQCVASVVFASAGGFLLFLQYRGLHSQSGEASGENDLAASLTAGSLLYSLSYAALSLSFYLFAWILRKYSAQLAKESSAKALLEVSRESRVDDMSAISSEQ